MSAGEDSILEQVKPKSEKTDGLNVILADTYKAVRAIAFYPEKHPKRNEIVAHLYDSLKEKELTLTINRNGFAIAGDPIKAASNQISSFAGELFIRRIQQLTFLHDLSVQDLQEFLQLLSMDQKNIARSGGMTQLMLDRGIRTIRINGINLSAIWEKQQALKEKVVGIYAPEGGKSETVIASSGHDGDGDTHSAQAAGKWETAFGEDEHIKKEEPHYPAGSENTEIDPVIMELLARMDQETDDNRYQKLSIDLAIKAEDLKEKNTCAPLVPVLSGLLRHDADENRSRKQKNYAVSTLERISEGIMTDFLINQLENKDARETARIYPVLKKLGAKIVNTIIQKLCLADKPYARKSLASALIYIGTPAIPSLLPMLKDERWYVVRNMVMIIGHIGREETANDLRPVLYYHKDQRVKRETVNALAKIGGNDAESMLIELIDDKDQVIVLHAVKYLGILKSRASVQRLIHIVKQANIFSRQPKLEKEAITALGKIGDQQATAPLLEFIKAHRWLPWNKWNKLKVNAAVALGKLGDKTALPSLKTFASRGGPLGKACRDAVNNIERVV